MIVRFKQICSKIKVTTFVIIRVNFNVMNVNNNWIHETLCKGSELLIMVRRNFSNI